MIACRTLRADVDPVVEAAFDATLAAIERDLGIPVTVVTRVFEQEDLPFRWFQISAAELAQSMAWCADRWDEFEPGLAGTLHFGAHVSADGLHREPAGALRRGGDARSLARSRRRARDADVQRDVVGSERALARGGRHGAATTR